MVDEEEPLTDLPGEPSWGMELLTMGSSRDDDDVAVDGVGFFILVHFILETCVCFCCCRMGAKAAAVALMLILTPISTPPRRAAFIVQKEEYFIILEKVIITGASIGVLL